METRSDTVVSERLHEYTVWARKKSNPDLFIHTILYVFIATTGGAVALDSTEVQNNPPYDIC